MSQHDLSETCPLALVPPANEFRFGGGGGWCLMLGTFEILRVLEDSWSDLCY